MNFFKDHLNLSNNIYDNAQILKAAEIKKQQEVVDRNPTTKYYQTLAQNLQEQVNNLKKQMLSEAGIVPPTPGVSPQPVLPGYNPATPPYPGITPVAPAPAPSAPTAPTPAQPTAGDIPRRPNPRGFPGGVNNPEYQRLYGLYVEWWSMQSKEYKRQHPEQAPPSTPSNNPGRYR